VSGPPGSNASPSLCPPANDQCTAAAVLALRITAQWLKRQRHQTPRSWTHHLRPRPPPPQLARRFWQFTAPATPPNSGHLRLHRSTRSHRSQRLSRKPMPTKIACNDDSNITRLLSGGAADRIPSVTLWGRLNSHTHPEFARDPTATKCVRLQITPSCERQQVRSEGAGAPYTRCAKLIAAKLSPPRLLVRRGRSASPNPARRSPGLLAPDLTALSSTIPGCSHVRRAST